jgi:ubiquitin carboxyl-terminal hydrolase 4/11/15
MVEDSELSPEQQATNEVLLLPASTTDNDNELVETQSVLRRYGSGLGNLGNTCFMNSSLQCLAHTDPLRKYFLSGDYERHLNPDNPLGTGGDLATQFAQLLADVWRTTTTKRAGVVYPQTPSFSISYNSNDPQSTANVVYPRNFKYTLGKHAEQFMGYDQHDSQELATYLLDALHEDTNRVTNKPYVEKPEQAMDESDAEAANKAWDLHLKREDSYVMQNFMAQVKSRVQCCKTECGRVSTTFDPIMFLSVPIPGSSERTILITFVPLDPMERAKSFNVTINKLASMGELLKKVQERIEKSNLTGHGYAVPIEDLAICDVWQHDVHSWHSLNKDVAVIRDNDETVVYELTSLAKIRELELTKEEPVDESLLGLRNLSPRPRRYQLDVGELTRLNLEDQWVEELKKYIRSQYSYSYAFDPKKGTTDERVSYFKKLTTFIDLCYKEVEANHDMKGQKRGREVDTSEDEHETIVVSPTDPSIREIEDRCDTQHAFENVKSLYHVTVLAFISKKLRAEILRIEKDKFHGFPDGVTLEVRMRKSVSHSGMRDQRLAAPLVLRVPSSTTVYNLREELAQRMERSLTSGPTGSSGERTGENEVVPTLHMNGSTENAFGSPSLLVLRQIPLSYQRKGTSNRGHISGGRQLGSLQKPESYAFDGTKPISLASSTEEEEKALVAEFAGDHGTVYLEWPPELAERYFDVTEFGSVDDADAEEGGPGTAKKGPDVITVLDCIDKFCQMEQLEETEMWYCNQCKEHVRAWKQFHIYRSPPILIIHLKRFQYSARSHRRDKINTFIDYPLKNLDLTEHVIQWSEEEKPIYDCYAVSNHYGGLGGGHYTAYALNDDGGWCYYDDSRITTEIDPKEVISDAAYVLYYRRRDVPVGEDFVMNLQTPGMSAPALIQVERGRDPDASEVSSSAAMVGDEMDIDHDTDDVASRVTSPMGSIADPDDALDMDGVDIDDVDDAGDERGSLPLQ